MTVDLGSWFQQFASRVWIAKYFDVEDDMAVRGATKLETLRLGLAEYLKIDVERIGFEQTDEEHWVWTILGGNQQTAMWAAAYLGMHTSPGTHSVMHSSALATVSDCALCGLPMQCYDKPDGIHWVCRNPQCRHEERAVVPKVAAKPKVVEVPYTHVPVDSHMKKRKAEAAAAETADQFVGVDKARDEGREYDSLTVGGLECPRHTHKLCNIMNGNYRCTLSAGHCGDHEAHGTYPLIRWSSEDIEPAFDPAYKGAFNPKAWDAFPHGPVSGTRVVARGGTSDDGVAGTVGEDDTSMYVDKDNGKRYRGGRVDDVRHIMEWFEPIGAEKPEQLPGDMWGDRKVDAWSTYTDGPVDGMRVVLSKLFKDSPRNALGAHGTVVATHSNNASGNYPWYVDCDVDGRGGPFSNEEVMLRHRPLKPAKVEAGQRWRNGGFVYVADGGGKCHEENSGMHCKFVHDILSSDGWEWLPGDEQGD